MIQNMMLRPEQTGQITTKAKRKEIKKSLFLI